MDLYYYLLNEVSVLECNVNNFDISANNSNKSYNNRIENILEKLAGKVIKIRLVDNDNNPPLKVSMINNFKKSDSWKMLEENFPGVKILDMVHKNGDKN